MRETGSSPEFHPDLWSAAVLATIAVGIALRAWQYFAHTSIWVDEAAIARNILDRNLATIFSHLDYGQVAPPGFLFGVKLSALIFGPSEYSLRLVPFIAGTCSLALFCWLAMKWLRREAAFAAMFLFATAAPLVVFSSNLKQYSTDVTATILALLLVEAVRNREWSLRTFIGYGLAGVALVGFSQSVIFVMGAGGCVLVLDGLQERSKMRRRFTMAGVWAAACLVAVAWNRHSMTMLDRRYMDRFWTGSYLPLNWGLFSWIWHRSIAVFSLTGRDPFDGSLHYPFGRLWAALLLAGVAFAWIRFGRRGLLLTGPILMLLLASSIRVYPVASRFLLFAFPIIIILVVFAADELGRLILGSHGAWIHVALAGLSLFALIGGLPPSRPEHLRPVMEYLGVHVERGDAVFVYYGAGQAFEYYRNLFPLKAEPIIGECDRDEVKHYLAELDVLRGRKRAWVVFAHANDNDRDEVILKYLDTIGRRMDRIAGNARDLSASAAVAFLYDLSDPQKLAMSSADTLPVANIAHEAWSCYGTMSPVASRNQKAERALLAAP